MMNENKKEVLFIKDLGLDDEHIKEVKAIEKILALVTQLLRAFLIAGIYPQRVRKAIVEQNLSKSFPTLFRKMTDLWV